MPAIRMDMSKTSDFSVVEPGDYPAHIFDIKQTVTKGGNAPGSPMLKVQYKLDGGKGSVWDNVVLNEASAWKFKQLCVGAGIEQDRLGEDAEIDTDELVGQPVILTLGIKPATQEYAEANKVMKIHNPDTYSGGAAATGQGWD
jgi:hypothetical protein